jgi:hypothetical protein
LPTGYGKPPNPLPAVEPATAFLAAGDADPASIGAMRVRARVRAKLGFVRLKQPGQVVVEVSSVKPLY